MLRLTCVVLFLALLAVGAKKFNINDKTDDVLEESNEALRRAGATSAPFPEIPVGEQVKYSNATVTGFDSLYRTGDSWVDLEDKSTSLDVRYGYRLLVLELPELTIDGEDMSAYLRIRNNSVHVALTVHTGTTCYVTLDDFSVERLEDVEFGASRAEYDGKDINSFFQAEVVPAVNALAELHWQDIERTLQFPCQMPNTDLSAFGSGFLLSVYENYYHIPW